MLRVLIVYCASGMTLACISAFFLPYVKTGTLVDFDIQGNTASYRHVFSYAPVTTTFSRKDEHNLVTVVSENSRSPFTIQAIIEADRSEHPIEKAIELSIELSNVPRRLERSQRRAQVLTKLRLPPIEMRDENDGVNGAEYWIEVSEPRAYLVGYYDIDYDGRIDMRLRTEDDETRHYVRHGHKWLQVYPHEGGMQTEQGQRVQFQDSEWKIEDEWVPDWIPEDRDS